MTMILLSFGGLTQLFNGILLQGLNVDCYTMAEIMDSVDLRVLTMYTINLTKIYYRYLSSGQYIGIALSVQILLQFSRLLMDGFILNLIQGLIWMEHTLYTILVAAGNQLPEKVEVHLAPECMQLHVFFSMLAHFIRHFHNKK